MTKRAYSVFELKSFDDDERTFEGIATTPSTDRIGDIVEPRGAVYKLPITMMWQHGKGEIKEPVGWITHVKVSDSEIAVKGKFAKLDWPLSLKEELDKAWARVKSKLVRGLSIGFNSIESVPIQNSYGERFTKWEWLELSPVSIAANADASITSIKSADALLRAVSGNAQRVVRLDQPLTPASVLALPKGTPVTIKDQITQFENKRAAAVARMTQIMEGAGTDGGIRTLEANEKEEHDTLEVDVKEIDEHLTRLRAHEKRLASTATAVTQQNTANGEAAAATRSGVIQVRSMAPPGIGVARMAIAMLQTRGNPYQAIELAKQRWGADMPEIAEHIRSVVEAGDTTTSGWASQLLPAAVSMDGLFLDMLRPMTVMGKLPLKDVPFNVSVPLQSGAGTYGYVGEGAPKPVTKPTYGSATLRFEKAAGIIVITEELFRFSSPKAELLVRDEMLKGLSNFFDTVFLGAAAAVSNVSPAGIRNGISATAASGTTAIKFRYDMNVIIQNMITNNQDPSTAWLVMSAGIAMGLSGMINSLGQSEFPTITAKGGNYLGIPIVVSQNAGTNIILIQPGDILLAEDPAARIDVSREASIEMDTAPAGGETSPVSDISTYKSFWQNNLVGFRVEQYRTWKVARTSAVEYLSGAGYTPPAS